MSGVCLCLCDSVCMCVSWFVSLFIHEFVCACVRVNVCRCDYVYLCVMYVPFNKYLVVFVTKKDKQNRANSRFHR